MLPIEVCKREEPQSGSASRFLSAPSCPPALFKRTKARHRLRRYRAQVLREELGYALKELPQPQVDFTFGLLNLNPEPSMDST